MVSEKVVNSRVPKLANLSSLLGHCEMCSLLHHPNSRAVESYELFAVLLVSECFKRQAVALVDGHYGAIPKLCLGS